MSNLNDFVIEDGVLVKYHGEDHRVVIPEGVTKIGDEAFYRCKRLFEITIPNSVTSIGDSAFSECENLMSVTIPDSVTSIGSSAFSFCESLWDIDIPDSVTSIGSGAFCGCDALAAYDGFVIVRDVLYYYWEGLDPTDHVVIPDGVTAIDGGLFSDYITSVTIPNSVISISERAFVGCDNLQSITIPGSVTSIGDEAFEFCSALTIYAPAGSIAEQYAKKYDIPFVAE